jgi:hypothetical protein
MAEKNDAVETLALLRKQTDILSEPPEGAPVTPPPARDGEDAEKIDDTDERMIARAEMRAHLRRLSVNELYEMFMVQAAHGARQGAGVPVERYLAHMDDPAQALRKLSGLSTKALDVPGAAALIRQDLEPILHEIFVKVFPAYDLIPKKPSNGLVHAWNRVLDYGTADLMDELGVVTDNQSTYEQATTPIAVIGTRRGISLKAQAAVAAGGMPYAPDQTEIRNGVRAVVAKLQTLTLQGNASVVGGTLTTEDGLYAGNGFSGLRHSVDVNNRTNLGTLSIAEALDLMEVQLINAGAMGPFHVFIDPIELNALRAELYPERRWDPSATMQIASGVTVNTHIGQNGPISLIPVPGNFIGHYTSGVDVRDITMFADGNLHYPWLFGDGPSVLEIPIGVSGQLLKLYIIFLMHGLEIVSNKWLAKVRVPV